MVHSCQKVEATPSAHQRVNKKQNAVYTYGGILFSQKKETPTHAITCMNLESLMLSESLPQTYNILIILM